MSVHPSTPLFRRLHLAVTRWYALALIVANPYRPELHYMRGPGPKCRAKQRAVARMGAV